MSRPIPILDGSLHRALIRLAAPLWGGYVFHVAFNWVDTYFVGRLGADAMAAVSSATFAVWALISLAELGSVGAAALVARAVGARDPDSAGRAVLAGLAVSGALGVAGMAVGTTLAPLVVRVTGLEGAAATDATAYLRVLFAGYPSLTLFTLAEGVFRGAGRTREPMVALAASSALNGVFDWLLIFGPGPFPELGVVGAAWATVFSRAAGVVALGFVFARQGADLGVTLPRGWLPKGGAVLRVARIGAPASAAGLVFSVIYFPLVRFAAEFGSVPVAALGLGLRLEMVAYLAVLSIGRAAGTIAGQCLGAEKPERARRGARLALAHAGVVVTPLAVVMALAPEVPCRFFIDDPAVVAAAASYLRVLSWAMYPMVLEVVLDAVAVGVGDTVPAMAIEVVGTGLRIPAAWGLVAALGSYHGVWWAVASTMAGKALAFWIWYRSGGWTRRRL